MKSCEVVKKSSVAIILLLSVFLNTSGQGAYIPPEQPRLVIGIVVEQGETGGKRDKKTD
jgi:hypothetical protein